MNFCVDYQEFMVVDNPLVRTLCRHPHISMMSLLDFVFYFAIARLKNSTLKTFE